MTPPPRQPAGRGPAGDGCPPESSEAPASPDRSGSDQPRADPWTQARQVCLAGNGLPARWAGRDHFTLLDIGFGLGHTLLATWDAWQTWDAEQPETAPRPQLHCVSLAAQGLSAQDLARALAASPRPDLVAALCAAWPAAAVRGLHVLSLAGGRLRLTLGLGVGLGLRDMAVLLSQMRLCADAVHLGDLAPDGKPQALGPSLFKALARAAVPGCTVASASLAPSLHQGLADAGFVPSRAAGLGAQRAMTTAVFRPHPRARQRADLARPDGTAPRPKSPAVRAEGLTADAVVLGAGIAGAAAARALAAAGLSVAVLDAAPEPASGASGNPAGLFHPIVNAEDGPYARLYRAAALRAAQVYAEAIATGRVPGTVNGLLRLASHGQRAASMQALLQKLDLPEPLVQAQTAAGASRLAGVAVAEDAWHFPLGGWVSPGDWVRHCLAQPGVRFMGSCPVARLQREGAQWQVLDAQQRVLARSERLVLANAAQALSLCPAGTPAWPQRLVRGQVTWWDADTSALKKPLAGDGYALPLPGRWLCGATQQPDDDDLALRPADQAHNLQRFARLSGQPTPTPAQCQGRAGLRLQSADRLPMAGGVPAPIDAQSLGPHRLLRPSHWPRQPGLFVLSALGARGLTLAPLLGELLAAQALGLPWPLEQDLADAVDPARFAARLRRRAG